MKIGAFFVFFVHEHESRHAKLRATAPEILRLHFDPFDGAHDNHGEIGDAKRRFHLTHKVRVPGRVEKIDPVAGAVIGCPVERRERERKRHLPFLLFRLEITRRRAIIHPTHPRGRPGPIQQCFSDRSLSRTRMPEQHDVSDSLRDNGTIGHLR